jgi:SAM-dependent methyltransferase
MDGLPPAAFAFDSIAQGFDTRFRPWRSVAAQRRAVRSALAEIFPERSDLLEIGAGTGEDAHWLIGRGRQVLATDASPNMVHMTAAKLRGLPGASTMVLSAEKLEVFATQREQGTSPFDGAYSNFAGLNCVTDLRPTARGLARLIRPGGAAALVIFGTCCPGEMVVEAGLGRFRNVFRRFARGDVPARLNGRSFTVRYHRRRALVDAMAPWFILKRRKGIGIFVPPSAAEPWISGHPRLLDRMEALDAMLAGPLAVFGDHILYHFERTDAEVLPA